MQYNVKTVKNILYWKLVCYISYLSSGQTEKFQISTNLTQTPSVQKRCHCVCVCVCVVCVYACARVRERGRERERREREREREKERGRRDTSVNSSSSNGVFGIFLTCCCSDDAAKAPAPGFNTRSLDPEDIFPKHKRVWYPRLLWLDRGNDVLY